MDLRRILIAFSLFAPSGCDDFWVDAKASGSGNGDGGAEVVESTWQDLASGLSWQNPALDSPYDFYSVVSYCDDLRWAGFDDWRLPTISELRSLIRGCAINETGGACGVTDSCLGYECFSDCAGCSDGGGPGDDGCYWDSNLDGTAGSCRGLYWTSSVYAGDATYMWGVRFDNGSVYYMEKTTRLGVRCVRGP
jgi:hypothetical protein